MRRDVSLPPEMAGLNIGYVQQESRYVLTSSCPYCGGGVHPNGEYPDRFVIFLPKSQNDVTRGWCRNCGKMWFPTGMKLSKEQHTQWLEERRISEEENLQRVKRALQLLMQEKKWLTYHDNLNGEVRQYLSNRRIDEFWMEYWKLGLVSSKKIQTKIGEWVTDAISIPVFEPVTKNVLNIRYRLLNPPTPYDKYRPEHGLPVPIFVTDYDKPLEGPALVVEGEFKSMTTYITLDKTDILTVGLPGKTPSQYVIDQLNKCEPIYLCLDPDASETPKSGVSPLERLKTGLGKERVRVISLADKIDDMILRNHLTKSGLEILIKTARR